MSNEIKFHYSFYTIHPTLKWFMNYVDTSVIYQIYDKVIRKSTNIECKMGMNSITKKSLRLISVAGSLTQLGSF